MRLPASSRRAGFSMVEALVSSTIVAIAGAALLTSLGAAVQASTEVLRQSVARGLADLLMDEIAAVRFPQASDTRPSGATTRTDFDDLDDYAGWRSQPPRDREGRLLGAYLPTTTVVGTTPLWQPRPVQLTADADSLAVYARVVEVETVEPDGSGGWKVASSETGYRRVTVRVDHSDVYGKSVTVVERTRILSDVATTP